jgi:hypothetical protein
MAGRKEDVGTHILPAHQTMNDIECFLNALRSFAELKRGEQMRLIADVTNSRDSSPRIEAVRLLLAESIDGCEDEEIADGLRYGAADEE